MIKIFNYIIVILLVVTMGSCQFLDNLDKIPDPEVEYASTYPVSGEYYVLYNHSEFGEDALSVGFTKIFVTNTAANDGKEIWIGDFASDPNSYEFYQYKVKIPVNMDNLTFGSETPIINNVDGYEIGITVSNGKIIENASLQPSGVMSDSIYFEITFDDIDLIEKYGASTDVLMVSGFRRTGFIEDEH